MSTIVLCPTRCAICASEGSATEIFPANLPEECFSPDIFSARRIPDRIHYRIVRCNTCGLIRSDPIALPEVIAGLYSQSHMDYGSEVDNLKRTYGKYLSRVISLGVKPGALLDIGCGDGFVLEKALELGFQSVSGIEPSKSAIEKADIRIRPNIVCGELTPGLLPEKQFDVISLFQVIDHLREPDVAVKLCWSLLKPGGVILCITHNVDSLSARLMRRNSPIIDIEHTYLFSIDTLGRLLKINGFVVQSSGSAWNEYSLHYLARLMPLPKSVKSRILNYTRTSPVGNWRFNLPLGNLYLIAKKP